jgi:hypothetical protein
MAALFVEMCVKLAASGETTNGALPITSCRPTSRPFTKLANTIASPLTATRPARMAESIRAVLQHQCPGDPLPA